MTILVIREDGRILSLVVHVLLRISFENLWRDILGVKVARWPEVQMARRPDGQKSKWPEVQMARGPHGQKA